MEVISCGVSQGNKFDPIILISLINDAFENAVTHSFKSVDDLSLAFHIVGKKLEVVNETKRTRPFRSI